MTPRQPPTAWSILAICLLGLVLLAWIAPIDPASTPASSSTGLAPRGEFPAAPEMPGRLAYARTEGAEWKLFVSDGNGDHEVHVAAMPEGNWPEHVRWSTDGKELIFDLYPGNATYSLSRVELASGVPTPYALEGNITDPAIARHDGRVAFAIRESADSAAPHDIVMLQDGTPVPLAAEAHVDERGPDWSSSGALVYERKSEGGSWDLWIADESGRRELLAWPNSHERAPRWNPDGDTVAFISGPYELGLGTLYVLDVKTGTATPLVSPADGPITWSPTLPRVVFHNPRIAGPEPAFMAGVPAAEGQVGLHVVDIVTREIWRLRGAAGGTYEDTLYGGYSPDWWAPSPTPTATPSPTATFTPTPGPVHLPWTANRAWIYPEPTHTSSPSPTATTGTEPAQTPTP